MRIFAFGSSILSAYWNGSCTYYRGIYKELARLGYEVTFAEPDAFGRQQHLDDEDLSYVRSLVYQPEEDLGRLIKQACNADIVVKHSGVGVNDAWLERAVLDARAAGASVIFWDVDAPATLARMEENAADPFRGCVPEYDAVLTYGGGPPVVEHYLRFGARMCVPIYNGLDPATHFPVEANAAWKCDLAFVGNRLPDREKRVEDLFLRAAELAPQFQFLLGGEGWCDKQMPANVRYIGHVPSSLHNTINASARMVININRDSMANVGFSPPTRVFEAAGTAACLLCDAWPGIDDCFAPGEELIVVHAAEDIVEALETVDEAAARKMGEAFRRRALRDHTYAQRAAQADAVFRERLRVGRTRDEAIPAAS